MALTGNPVNEEATTSSNRLKGLTEERMELEGTRQDLVQRMDTLQILIAAEEAKLKALESNLPKAEPSFDMPDQLRPRYT